MTEREKLLEILYDMPEVQTLKENADYLLEHGVTLSTSPPTKYILRETIVERLNSIGGCGATDEYSKGWDEAIDEAIKILNDTSAVYIASINHGHWIKTGGYVCGDYEFKCSACGETYWEGSNYAERAHFCLNCGAKMIFAVKEIKE